MDETFESELAKLINKYSVENGSGTPDFILAHYVGNCLAAFNVAIKARESWYGRSQDKFGMPKGTNINE